MIVLDSSTGDSYTSKKAVPAGIELSNTDYWARSGVFNAQLKETYDGIVADNNETEAAIKADNDATEKAIKADNDATEAAIKADNDATESAIKADNEATESAIKADNDATETAVKEDNTATKSYVDSQVKSMTAATDAAVNLTTTNRTELEERMASIEARQDANVSASTNSNADYAAEVVDARVGWDEQSYGSLGAAIRGLAGQALKYAGVLYRNRGTDDLNDLEVNTFYLVSSSSGETTLINYPEYNNHGLIITVGAQKILSTRYFTADGETVFSFATISSQTAGMTG